MAVRVSGGHVYDPQKARVVGSCFRGKAFDPERGEVPADGICERLQRTKAGKYFVYGIGGKDTRYAKQTGAEWIAGTAVTPVSREDAETWARRHLSQTEWEAEFGEPDPSAMRTISVRIPERVYRAIRDEASELGRSMGDVIAARFARSDGRE